MFHTPTRSATVLSLTLSLVTLCASPAPAQKKKQQPARTKTGAATNASTDATASGRTTEAQAPAANARSQTSQPAPQPTAARQVLSSILIRWEGKPGIERYRLQVASDPAFNDVVFDEAVRGRQHVVKVSPGRYYWRVAPAVRETGAFSEPKPVDVTPAPVENVRVASAVLPPEVGGWRTATGEVARPVAARLRPGNFFDLLGVNTDGTVFAIDGANGIALWTARYRPDARRGEEGGTGKVTPFAPVQVSAADGTANVLVGYDGGVRALRGETGRELWRAKITGRAESGVTTEFGNGSNSLIIVTTEPDALLVLDAQTGRTITEEKLSSPVIGAPFPFVAGEVRGVALALRNGTIEIRGSDAKVVRSEKLNAELTTAPLVFTREGMAMLIVGTEQGLVAFTLADLKALGRIVPEDDVVHGTLKMADLDSDGAPEIIIVTKRGRVALVSTLDGTVKWYAEGVADAESATFADLNSDGVLDVIVPAGTAFAAGFSGRDGTLIWKVEEDARARGAQAGGKFSPRTFAIAPYAGGGGVLVGSDPARMGLRAVELPKGAVKTAAR